MPRTHAYRVAEPFGRAARLGRYDHYAALQRQVADKLLAVASLPSDAFMLDAGCGTGYASRQHKGQTINLDLAEAMCRKAHSHKTAICADMQALPFADHSFDAVFSSMAAHWLDHPTAFLQESLRVARARGELRLAVPGPATLRELRRAYQAAGSTVSVHDFTPASEWQNWIQQAGWKRITIMTQRLQKQQSFAELCRELSALGAGYRHAAQAGLGAGAKLSEVRHAYETLYARGRDKLPVTWEILYFLAQKS
jgi:malonyl-CoA O-methyltransferase